MPKFTCPACHQSWDVPIFRLGTRGPCAKCGRQVLITLRAPGDPAQSGGELSGSVDANGELVAGPIVDEGAIAAAAAASTKTSRNVAYGVAAMVVVVFGVAIASQASGVPLAPGLWNFLTISGFVGTALFATYWFPRDEAYARALEAERLRATGEDWSRTGASIGVAFISLAAGVSAASKGFKLGAQLAGGGGGGGGGDIFANGNVLVIAAIVIGALLMWWITSKYGFVRALSLVQIVFAVGCSGYAVLTLAEAPNRSGTVAAGADAEVAKRCIAPRNVGLVTNLSKAHGSDKLAFVEIDNRELSDEMRVIVFDDLRSKPNRIAEQRSADDGAIEVVFAPIEDLEQLARQFDKYEVVSVEKSQQRIKLRPKIPLLRELAESARERNEFQSLMSSRYHAPDWLQKIRLKQGREHVIVVDVLYPEQTTLENKFAAFRRIRQCAPILATKGSVGLIKYVVIRDDLAGLAKELNLGTVVDVDEDWRVITVDLAEMPRPFVRPKGER